MGAFTSAVPGEGLCLAQELLCDILEALSAKAMSDSSLPGVKGAPETLGFQKGLLRKWMERNLSTDFSFTLRGSIRDVMLFKISRLWNFPEIPGAHILQSAGMKPGVEEAKSTWRGQSKNDGKNWTKLQSS